MDSLRSKLHLFNVIRAIRVASYGPVSKKIKEHLIECYLFMILFYNKKEYICIFVYTATNTLHHC